MSPKYLTVRVTPGRISKGLLSIPVSLKDFFPSKRQSILVALDDSNRPVEKPFSPYESTTRECRIYGLSNWYSKHGVTGGERIVITVIDQAQGIYRLCFEDFYLLKSAILHDDFYSSGTERHADTTLQRISRWISRGKKETALAEFADLSRDRGFEARRRILAKAALSREQIPYSMKVLLRELYDGHCQVCDFTFLKTDGQPYFEVHHLEAQRSHHPKNVLCVCANCHSQFEYANVRYWRNPQKWVIRVRFNDRVFAVRQALVGLSGSTFSVV